MLSLSFGADGVDLAVHFLRQKIERATDWFPSSFVETIVELLEMALQPP